jgi:hypothetical protein
MRRMICGVIDKGKVRQFISPDLLRKMLMCNVKIGSGKVKCSLNNIAQFPDIPGPWVSVERLKNGSVKDFFLAIRLGMIQFL